MTRRGSQLVAVCIAMALGALYAASPLIGGRPTGMRVDLFGGLPAQSMGRVKPIDSVARDALLVMSGRQSVRSGDGDLAACAWLLELWTRPDRAGDIPLFRVDHPSLRATLALADPGAKRFSYNAIMAHSPELQQQIQLAAQVPPSERDLFHRRALELGEQIMRYQTLAGMSDVALVPPMAASPEGVDHWLVLSRATATDATAEQRSVATRYAAALDAYRNHDIAGFNRGVAELRAALATLRPGSSLKASREAWFNRAAPFAHATVLYIVAGLMIAISWLRWRGALSAAALGVLLLTIAVHTAALAMRVYLSGRPPVTNLYSSALFIGWGGVVFCLVLEALFRNGLGLVTGAVIGCLTLIIAQGLSGNGDNLSVLQAVLDTNFWLATHVIVITLGYASTYLAGFLGIAYVVRRTLTRSFSQAEGARMAQMIYGILCFATLLSFVGTILGGIWADQSWGRFWGWDPKENGALIIVLWNALILHARWGGMVRQRGLALLAIFGNVVTSWSWFGVNMLGRGLHSYGFIDSAAFWLVTFVGAQFAFIAMGFLPGRSSPQNQPGAAVPSPRRALDARAAS